MKRREFIALLGGAAASAPFAARAQQAGMVTIGILNFQNPEPFRTMLRDDLRDLGYAEGRNLKVEFRSAEGSRDRISGLAAELVGLHVDVLVAYPTPAAVALQQATREIPIVMLGAGDPVGTGLVASLARPGGNVTGTSSTTAELGAKTLELVRDFIPSAQRVAVLANAADPFTKSFLQQMQMGAPSLGLEIQTVMINEPDELDSAFAAMKQGALDAAIVQPSLPRKRVADLALKNHILAIAPSSEFAVLGGLAAYGPSQTEMIGRTASIIDKVLKRSKPAELPVEQPTKFELTINLKTARALGITVPPALLSRADEVIE
jgi:putative tryptophan/tyrosine transport system substrate-binding protein